VTTTNKKDLEHQKEHLAMKTPSIVSPQEWEAARQQLLVKEKAFTRSRDALAAERRGQAVPLNRVLAIGDSVRTDLTGAHGFGIDCLFVTRGIHSEEFEGIDQLDPASVKELFGHPPRALTRELRW